MFKKIAILSVLILGANFGLKAAIKLPSLIGNDMVMQRDKPVRVWGWADKGERIRVQFGNKTYKTITGNDGKWQLMLPPTPAGGPYTIMLKGKNQLTLSNIMFGDVWICSGQSNMEWALNKFNYAEKEAANANFPQIRIYTVPRDMAFKPLDNSLSAVWKPAVQDNIKDFSAVAYFYGRKLYQELKIPIGLINTSWGGTNIETWTSGDAIQTIDHIKPIIQKIETKTDSLLDIRKKAESLSKQWTDLYATNDAGLSEAWYNPTLDVSAWQTMQIPNHWENAGLPNYDGIVWFRKDFTLPERYKNKDLYLRLGQINDYDKVWINGNLIGETKHEKDWRKYIVPASVLNTNGKNTIAIRVFDNGDEGGINAKAENINLAPIAMSDDPLMLAGPWQYKPSLKAQNLAPYKQSKFGPNDYPTLLYNAMLSPLLPMSIKGVIWYQGESNAERAYEYRTLFPLLIKNWRQKWGQGDFPFYFVQLANYKAITDEPQESSWAELREAQTMTLALPNTGMATIIDIGEGADIHPKNKQDVGLRLALTALKLTYNQNIVHSGPSFASQTIEGNKIRIKFNNEGSGLVCKNKFGYVNEFAIAGKDKKYIWAKAYVDGNSVVVYNDNIKEPVAVRYAWSDNPDQVNLYNKEGLPAVPFRTDDWPGITFGKK